MGELLIVLMMTHFDELYLIQTQMRLSSQTVLLEESDHPLQVNYFVMEHLCGSKLYSYCFGTVSYSVEVELKEVLRLWSSH